MKNEHTSIDRLLQNLQKALRDGDDGVLLAAGRRMIVGLIRDRPSDVSGLKAGLAQMEKDTPFSRSKFALRCFLDMVSIIDRNILREEDDSPLVDFALERKLKPVLLAVQNGAQTSHLRNLPNVPVRDLDENLKRLSVAGVVEIFGNDKVYFLTEKGKRLLAKL